MNEVKALAVTEISCQKFKCAEVDGRQLGATKKRSFVELNLDCLLEIFEYLPVLDRIRVARVNKKWHEASRLSLSRLKSWKIEYVISKIVFVELKTNLRIEVDYKSRAFEELLLRFGKFVSELDVSQVKNEFQLMIILSTCRNLVKADFSSVNIEKVRFQLWALDKLTDLSLRGIHDMDDGHGVYGCLENILSRLRLRSLHIDWHRKLDKKFLKSLSPDIKTLEIVQCKFTNTSSAFDILGNFKNLKSLTFHHTLPNNTNVEHFINLMKKLNLKKLNISWNFKVVDDDFLIKLAKYAGNLIELDISGNNVTDVGLNAVTNLQNLEVLIIQDLKHRVKGDVDVNLPNLKCLRSRNSNLGEEALIKFLNTSDKIEYMKPGKISEEFILAAGKVAQARKSKIPSKILIDTNDEKILEIVNKIPEEHTRLLKFHIFKKWSL